MGVINADGEGSDTEGHGGCDKVLTVVMVSKTKVAETYTWDAYIRFAYIIQRLGNLVLYLLLNEDTVIGPIGLMAL